MSETKRYRKFTAQQKTEIVLASLRGPKSLAELCREHEIADSLLRKWREQFLAAGAERLSGKTERTEADELRRQVADRTSPSPAPRGQPRRLGNRPLHGSCAEQQVIDRELARDPRALVATQSPRRESEVPGVDPAGVLTVL